MDFRKLVFTPVIVWLLLGLLGGGLATDLWWRRRAADLTSEVAALKTSQAEQVRRTDEAVAKLRTAERELKELGQQLNAERDLRHRYEDVLTRGRK